MYSLPISATTKTQVPGLPGGQVAKFLIPNCQLWSYLTKLVGWTEIEMTYALLI